ncbi:hypothetical protein [Desulfobacterium sp. N47]|uniref:Uncharacterized protein n=1 Tax=uncultured Desulfobacterium sp. TaxID=201089 RepID=E1YEL1_9BACT|nr:hypothetical protein N47_P17100 [uncultured Desulfobacterium sp.]
MTTPADLERLQKLLKSLQPLAEKQAGDPVQSQDWNMLARTLISLAQTLLAREMEPTVVPHTHTEQVSLSWLDPKLRNFMEQGPLGDPAITARLLKIEKNSQTIVTRIDSVANDLEKVRNQVSDVSLKDIVRESSVTTLNRKVTSIADGRDDVVQLRTSLNEINKELATVMEAADAFKIDGKVADMTGINNRIKSVEELRKRLTNSSGELLDASKLEIRLADLENTLVTEEELDAAIKNLIDATTKGLLEKVHEESNIALREIIDKQAERIAASLREEVLKKIPEPKQIIEEAVAKQMGILVDQKISTLSNDLDKKIADAKDSILKTVLDSTSSGTGDVKPSFEVDDLTKVYGIGTTFAVRLNEAHINSYKELAALSHDELAEILHVSVDRIKKYQFVEQAKELVLKTERIA